MSKVRVGVRKKIWVYKANSFRSAQDFDLRYYRSLSPQERLETVEFLRQQVKKIRRPGSHYAKSREGLRRVITVIQ